MGHSQEVKEGITSWSDTIVIKRVISFLGEPAWQSTIKHLKKQRKQSSSRPRN